MGPRLPAGITLVDCAAVPDGGSLTVVVQDETGARRRLFLARGIADMRAGTEHLSLDGHPIEAGSQDEACLIALLDEAARAAVPDGGGPLAELVRSIGASMVAYVRSEKYRRGWPPPPDPMDEIRSLLAAAQRQKAILRYRALFAPIALADARIAVDALARSENGKG